MTEQLLAFHNKASIKKKYLARVKAHEKADEIIKGVYWENGKGCAVGCTIQGSDHKRYETELGLPEWLALLEDTLFENLSNGHAKTFPRRFLESINVGADLSLVKPKFLYYVLTEIIPKDVHKDFPDAQKSSQAVLDLLLREIKKEKVAESEWASAWASARASEASARASAWASARASARASEASAWASARASEASAWASAWASARASEASAWASANEKMADKLLELLKECKK